MNDIQIKGSEDYGKLCCFRDDEGNEVYGHLSLFMKAISNNPNERDMYFRKEDGKAYRMAWKVDEEDVLSPDEEEIHEQAKKIERLQSQLKETQQELQIRINDNADMYANLCNTLMQLEEANQIIKWYNSLENLLIDGGWQLLTGQKKGTAEKYLKKWSVE